MYKGNGTTEVTTGVTLTTNFDGKTGLHNLRIALTDSFYAVDKDYAAVITAGKVDSIDLTGYVVCTWSVNNRGLQDPS